ncbi:PLP-dependent aminotransferase family protein [Nonomuraea mangrovi]|uniref:PLP-dependent aminotransferase family protein n=1 Tax=Nonomuraea mangrovi TaxID=2316207 RepID=A0ABW4SN47_9ACTN
MSSDWSTSRELLLPAISSAPHGARGRALEQALKEAVRTGRLAGGVRLPSTRDLAAQLGVARGTVTAAYDQLTAEGYLVARRGSGTRVAEGVAMAEQGEGPPTRPRRELIPLRPGLPSMAAFPRTAWLAATRAGLAGLADAELSYPDPAGLAGLRAELAAYLGRVRGVSAGPEEVVVTHGTFESIGLLAAVLRDRGHTTVAVEELCNRDLHDLLELHGFGVEPVTLDEHGLDVEALERTGSRAVVVTAAHQYPLGVALHPARRRALADWARRAGGLVIEDDYDAEYRYDRAPLSAVQGLAPSHVAYLGTLSKTLAPAVRLGWMVVPAALRHEVVRRKELHDRGVSTLQQAAFAHFLREGGYDRHLRRTTSTYRRRRDALLAALAEQLPSWRPYGIAAGLHVVLRLPEGTDDAALAAHLSDHGIATTPLSAYGRAAFPAIVVGYARLSPERLHEAVARLRAAVGPPTVGEASGPPSI